MTDFFELISEGFRLAANLGKASLEVARTAVLAYFAQVRRWTIRLALAAALPLVVVIPCLLFQAPFGGLYGGYVVWVVLLAAAELLLLTPMYLVWRRVESLLPQLAGELRQWLDFIKSVVFNGLSMGIFVSLFPVWRSPGALPLLLLILACWVTLPMSGVSTFFKQIYPAVRALQLVALTGILVVKMSFPEAMQQLGWVTHGKIIKGLTSSVNQTELTSGWKDLTWFENTGEPRVWYSKSGDGGYRLWGAPGFDAQTGERLQPVENAGVRDLIVAELNRRDLASAAEANARAEAARRQTESARVAGEADSARRAEALRAQEETRRNAAQEAEQRATEAATAMRRRSYLSTSSLPSSVDLIVAAASTDNQPADAFSDALVRYLRGRGKSASANVFSSAFISGGAFDAFYRGQGGDDLRAMPVAAMGRRIILVRLTFGEPKTGTVAAGFIYIPLKASFSVVSAVDGSVIDRFVLDVVGAGSGRSGATTAAIDMAMTQLSQHGY